MKHSLLIISFCLFAQTAFCQGFMLNTKTVLGEATLWADDDTYKSDTLDRAQYLFTYKQRICVDPQEELFFEENYILLKGARYSKYQSLNKYLYDTDLSFFHQKIGNARIQNSHYAFCYDALYFDNESEKMEVAGRLMQDDVIYEEPVPVQSWSIGDSLKVINGYTCRKAEADFRGRNYVVWFTDEVPVSLGPWKLHGLPGLIVYAYDETGQYSFTLDTLGETDSAIVKPRYLYSKVSRKTFNKNQSQYLKDRLHYSMAHSGPGLSFTNDKRKQEPSVQYDILELDF